MGLKTPAGTDVYCATGNSVALQQIGVYRLTRAHARKAQTRKTCSATANGVALSRPLPLLAVTVLKHCRCIDCRHWIGKPYFICKNGINGPGGFPADHWHYCADYIGPQISRDVWVWPKGSSLVRDVGPRSQDSCEGDHNARAPTGADTGERGATT